MEAVSADISKNRAGLAFSPAQSDSVVSGPPISCAITSSPASLQTLWENKQKGVDNPVALFLATWNKVNCQNGRKEELVTTQQDSKETGGREGDSETEDSEGVFDWLSESD